MEPFKHYTVSGEIVLVITRNKRNTRIKRTIYQERVLASSHDAAKDHAIARACRQYVNFDQLEVLLTVLTSRLETKPT